MRLLPLRERSLLAWRCHRAQAPTDLRPFAAAAGEDAVDEAELSAEDEPGAELVAPEERAAVSREHLQGQADLKQKSRLQSQQTFPPGLHPQQVAEAEGPEDAVPEAEPMAEAELMADLVVEVVQSWPTEAELAKVVEDEQIAVSRKQLEHKDKLAPAAPEKPKKSMSRKAPRRKADQVAEVEGQEDKDEKAEPMAEAERISSRDVMETLAEEVVEDEQAAASRKHLENQDELLAKQKAKKRAAKAARDARLSEAETEAEHKAAADQAAVENAVADKLADFLKRKAFEENILARAGYTSSKSRPRRKSSFIKV